MDEARETVLFVDDEQYVLNALGRLFMDEEMVVVTTSSPYEALEMLHGNDISVVVSDNIMPGMTGIELLQKAKVVSPDTVRVMMTGQADLQSAVDAINKGEVLRYILKPWDDEEFKESVASSINSRRIIRSMRTADEHTLYALAQMIELKDPYTRGHCDRVAKYATAIAEKLDLDTTLRKYITHGSWLHDCGKIGVPEAILNYHGRLSPDQKGVVKRHPVWGAEVARLAHLPEPVVNIILYHHERYDGAGYMGLSGDRIPVEARIVSVADTYDALTSDRPYQHAVAPEEAQELLLGCSGSQLDPGIVDIFVGILGDEQHGAGGTE
jgi:putative nucleotidyltransferase with HDIG domain